MLDVETPAKVLQNYYPYTERAEIIAGMTDDGLVIDEVSNVGPTKVAELMNGKIVTYVTNPEDWGVTKATKEEIAGGDGSYNARITIEILLNQRHDAHKDLLLINASQFLYLAGIVQDRKAGTELARATIASGHALAKLKEFSAESGGDTQVLKALISNVQKL